MPETPVRPLDPLTLKPVAVGTGIMAGTKPKAQSRTVRVLAALVITFIIKKFFDTDIEDEMLNDVLDSILVAVGGVMGIVYRIKGKSQLVGAQEIRKAEEWVEANGNQMDALSMARTLLQLPAALSNASIQELDETQPQLAVAVRRHLVEMRAMAEKA